MNPKRDQGAKDSYLALLHHSADGIVVVDQRGLVRFINPAAEQLLGTVADEILGRPFPFPLGPGSQEVRIDHPAHRLVIADLRATETAWNGERAWLASLRDITAWKRDEQKIRAQHLRLQELNRHLHDLASSDSLTGLKNHGAFKRQVNEELRRAKRCGPPLSLLLLDVDRFKEYNDAFGHIRGDEALKKLARVLRQNSRKSDFIARYGGEEFAVLLRNCGRVEALRISERLRRAIENTKWRGRGITASIGAATFQPGVARSRASNLIGTADKALYYSKQNGRNRATHAEDLAPSQLPRAFIGRSAASADQARKFSALRFESRRRSNSRRRPVRRLGADLIVKHRVPRQIPQVDDMTRRE